MTHSTAISRLVEQRLQLLDSNRNRQAQALFQPRLPDIVHDKFREVPRPLSDIGKIPVVAVLDRPLWAKLLAFPLNRYYLEPLAFVEYQLRMDAFHLENIPDDQFFDESIQVWGGPGFEASLFGMRQEYSVDNEPWLRHEPIIKTREDLDALPQADFVSSGPMPQVLAFYEELQSLLDGTGLRPIPPGWIRGPLGVAEELRGIGNLVMEFITDPELAQAVLKHVVDFRKAWCQARSRFLDSEHKQQGLMYNDEVQVPMISPKIYRDMVLPLELELDEFYEGLHYWHSCGDATPFMPLVAQLPRIVMIQCGAFSNPEEVMKHFAQRTAIEIAVRPQQDFAEASEEHMRARLEYLVDLVHRYDVKSAFIRLTAYETSDLEPHQALHKVQRWVEIAQEVTRAAA